MSIVSEKPLIEILSPEEQHDRFDINYYLPEFIHAERYIENCEIELTTLGDVMTDDASYGVLPPSSSYLEEGGISLVRSSNVSNSGIDYESAVRVPSEWINSERARIKSNDVLISIKGARAFFDMCVASDNPPDAIVNGSVFRFQCEKAFNPRFVVFWLLSKHIQSLVFRERANLGISYISRDSLNAIPIPKIGLERQNNILAAINDSEMVLAPFERRITDTESQIASYKKQISDVFKNEFSLPNIIEPIEDKVFLLPTSRQVDRLDVRGNQKTYFTLLSGLEENKSFMAFEDVAKDISNGLPARNYCDSDSENARRYLLVADIKNGKIVDDSPSYIDNTEEKVKLTEKTLLFTRKGTVGEVAVPSNNEIEYVPCYELICIDLCKLDDSQIDLIKYFYLSDYGRLLVYFSCSGGQMPSISQERFKQLKVPLVQAEECNRINRILSEVGAEILNMEELIKLLKTSRNSMFSDFLAIIFDKEPKQALKDLEGTVSEALQ